MEVFSLADVASRPGVCVAIEDGVYDLTDFVEAHPGGAVPLLEAAGTDATKVFFALHRAELLTEPRFARLRIGRLADAAAPGPATPVPYAEAMGTWRRSSPYYKPSHLAFRSAVAAFIDAEVLPIAADHDERDAPPPIELNRKMGQAGLLAAVVGRAAPLLEALGHRLPGGVAFDDFDEFHELILTEEIKRTGTYGFSDGLVGGLGIGLPPVVAFGTTELVHRVAAPVLSGERRICLCISEPYAGSDVAQIRTHAELAPDGTHYTLAGVKKWITGGMFADWFTVLARTPQGMVLLAVERDDTVTTRRIKTSYSGAAGTAYVEFRNTMVPVANVIGKPGQGFLLAMSNFNKERWSMVAGGNRLSRLMVEQCMKWALQREVFGKRLIDQPVIRQKLAQMAAAVESVHSLLEDVTFQMTQMSEKEVNKFLAGPIALLKFQQTRVATLVSDHACQILGGRGLTRSGMGQMVERFQRSFKMQAILGGSEEIMADFAIRQALKATGPTTARL